MPFRIVRGDIINIEADAIVNTANPGPVAGKGTDADIYRAAGRFRLLRARKKIGVIAEGEAALTPAFKLNAKYIIHTVGPVWKGGRAGELQKLADCYRESLRLAKVHRCRSIAFPLISSGNNGFPKCAALDTALDVFRDFLEYNDMDITLVIYDSESFGLSEKLLGNVESYIDDNYIYRKRLSESSIPAETYHSGPEIKIPGMRPDRKSNVSGLFREDAFTDEVCSAHLESPALSGGVLQNNKKDIKKRKKLKNILDQVGEDFRGMLFRLIDERGLTDTEVYKKANIDRKLFSKIRCNKDYIPKKQTVLALVFALELNFDETVDLISRAGIAFSPGSKFDVILEFCIENGIYDLFEVNSLLFEYGQPQLGE